MRFPIAALVTLAASTCTHAEMVAQTVQIPSSNSAIVIELHNTEADPEVCQGRTGFPLALIGAGIGLTSNIQKVGTGCWAPDGAGNIVVTAVGYPNGNQLKAVKSINDFTKTEHFTDWNAAPIKPGQPPEGDGSANRVERMPEGYLVTSLYDIRMPCRLSHEAYIGAVEGIADDGSKMRVNGCWVRSGDAIAFDGFFPGGKPFSRRYVASDFTGVIPSQ